MPLAAAPGRMRVRAVPARGFTLIELIVVLVIAAIAVAVVGVSAQTYMARARYHQTVLDLATQFDRARGLAREQGRAVLVSYDPQARRLSVDGKEVLVIDPSVQVAWKAAEHVAVPAPTQGAPLFLFNADGRARGGQIEIARGAQGVLFQINWLLGTVRQTAVAAP